MPKSIGDDVGDFKYVLKKKKKKKKIGGVKMTP
jgi:hypothetical protein